MDVGILPNLQAAVSSICDNLLKDNKLITTKNVIDVLSVCLKHPIDANQEESVTKIISKWRLSRLQPSAALEPSKIINLERSINYNKICKKLSKYTKHLVKAKREIKFLRAKIKALNSFYNRQRQEFIMRIEGMLYK